MNKYIKRISDAKLEQYLKLFGAVLVEGPKWCGKTESGKQYAATKFELADPSNNFRNRSIAELDPQQALDGESPRLIDEWQEVPALWDAVRYRADNHSKRGQYILTGSSTPNDTLTIHSGAGRIGRLRMSTMTLQELDVSKAKISLGDLLYDHAAVNRNYAGALSLDTVIDLICKGGWPGLIGFSVNDSLEVLQNYVKALTNEDLSKIDDTKRDPAKVSALLQSVSRNSASLVSRETIRKDIEQYSSVALHASTVAEYLTLLTRMFVLNEIPAWEPALKSTVRLRVTPKRMLVDPSLAVASLKATPSALKQDLKLTGNLFESLVIRDLLVYAHANNAEVYHYHDNSNLEIDAVVEGKNKEWGAIEIKLGYTKENEASANLRRLVSKIEGDKQKPPRFLAVITGVGSILKQRDDGVYVIPVDLLGV
jgi:predicted AAA+ superfamily ATPase